MEGDVLAAAAGSPPLLNQLMVLFLAPVCAIATGLVVAFANRGLKPSDGSLVRQFLLMLAILMAVTWGIGRRPSVQRHFDPVVELRLRLESDPVYAAIRQYSPDDFRKVNVALGRQLAQGAGPADAWVRIRPLLFSLARERLDWVDAATTLEWSRHTLTLLSQLNASDPKLCLNALHPPADSPHPLSRPLPDDAAASALVADIADVYKSADAGMRHGGRAPAKPVARAALQADYRVLLAQLQGSFGNDIDRTREPAWRAANPARFCDIVTGTMSLILAREPPMASALLRNYPRADLW